MEIITVQDYKCTKNMSQRYNARTKRAKPKENQLARDLKDLSMLPENSAEGPRSRSTAGVNIYLWEYTQKIATSSPLKLPLEGVSPKNRFRITKSSDYNNIIHSSLEQNNFTKSKLYLNTLPGHSSGFPLVWGTD